MARLQHLVTGLRSGIFLSLNPIILAIRRQQAIPATDSWSPVFVRYTEQFSDELSGLGIDPGLIGPSQDDPGVPGRLHKPKAEAFTGKVSKVFFDCFGDFTGFVLTSCETSRHFKTTEKGICELVLRACKDRLTLTVRVYCGHEERIGESSSRYRNFAEILPTASKKM
jgi:hypothetical protein